LSKFVRPHSKYSEKIGVSLMTIGLLKLGGREMPQAVKSWLFI
jgi:hypothetical protein